MTIGIIGLKVGMTRVFSEEGNSTPVTVVSVADNKVSQIKTTDTDGYNAIQVSTGAVKASKVTKPLAGHFAKAGVEAVSFDRGGNLYHGRVKSLAEGAREGGLKF